MRSAAAGRFFSLKLGGRLGLCAIHFLCTAQASPKDVVPLRQHFPIKRRRKSLRQKKGDGKERGRLIAGNQKPLPVLNLAGKSFKS